MEIGREVYADKDVSQEIGVLSDRYLTVRKGYELLSTISGCDSESLNWLKDSTIGRSDKTRINECYNLIQRLVGRQ